MVTEASDQSDEETWFYDFEHFEYFLHFDYIEANFDHLKDSLGDLTFETSITILTIENLNSINHCYLTINCDTGQHSQFLWCFKSGNVKTEGGVTRSLEGAGNLFKIVIENLNLFRIVIELFKVVIENWDWISSKDCDWIVMNILTKSCPKKLSSTVWWSILKTTKFIHPYLILKKYASQIFWKHREPKLCLQI